MTGRMKADERLYAVGLGANMGDRLAHLNRALARIDRIPHTSVAATARVYHSAGWGRPNLKPFLNTALAARSSLEPLSFLHELQRIENELGRQRELKWGPRVIDLDLLADDRGTVLGGNELQLPHPWIAQRPFVYFPLRELAATVPAWEKLTEPTADARAIEKDSVPADRGQNVWGRIAEPTATRTIVSPSEDATKNLAKEIAPFLVPGDVIALNAAMGAGKSVFARGIARGLGIEGPIQSPTFTLCRSYEAHGTTFEHWDFYRLGSEDDLESTGFFTPESARAIRVIEWAEYFPEAVGKALLQVRMEVVDADTRRIELTSPSGRLPFAVDAIAEAAGSE